jgi:chromosome segregation ATPase
MAAQLREQLQEAESRVVAADAANVQAAKREEALREESGEQSLVLEAMSKQVEQLQVERSNLQETLSKATAENTRLLDQMGSSEKEHNKKIEELLHQVELWEAEANRLSVNATEQDAIVTQMRAEAEQLYNELGALHQSADETQATLSSRARKAEAEVVRLRLQVSQIEDSAEDSVAGHEEESARHMAELRSEISRLLVQESEAKDLAQTHASRVAELEGELAANQSAATAAAESAAVAAAEAQEKFSAMESRAQNAEEVAVARLTELGALEEKIVSLSSQLVSSNKEYTSSKAALEQRISMAQRDNGKFVLELSSMRGELAELRVSATSMATVHAEKDKQIGALSQDVLSLTQQLNELQQQLEGRDAAHADSVREQAEAFEARVTQVRNLS